MNPDVLFRRLKVLMVFRVVFASLLLGTYRIFEIGYYKNQYSSGIIYLIVSLYILTILYSLFMMRVRNIKASAYLQLSLDTLAGVILIFLTGGIESWFSFILLLIVMASAIIIDKKAGYFTATMSSIFYGLLIDLQFYGIVPVAYSPGFEEKDFFYNIFSHISAFYLTAVMTGYLSSRLEKTSESLEQRDSDLRDLTLFNAELIESLTTGLLTTNREGIIVFSNRAACGILGIEDSAIVSKNMIDIFPFIEPPYDKVRVEGAIIINKEQKTVGLIITPIVDNRGSRTGYICTFQDITRLKSLENELKRRETLAAIGEMSANMAHEIRNPLASLRSSIEMLKERPEDMNHSQKLMNIALFEMDRLNKIITDFLAYSRPRPPEFTRFSLNSLLDEVADMLRYTFVKKSGLVIWREYRESIEINADPHKLRQAFLNLGMNAAESIQDRGELAISARRDRDNVIVSFKDTGAGISPENLLQIFYPFFTTKEEGTGLGLPIAHRIIEEHKGRLNVRSRPGHGSVFEVILPAGNNSGQEAALSGD